MLAYRRLIEMARAEKADERLTPDELSAILVQSIYGVERNLDACYVTEFSLILTLLSYVEPPELHRNENFKFPSLHNIHIFNFDFFDDNTPFWKQNFRFDWIIGNPPWFELPKKPQTGEDREAPIREWIETNNKTKQREDYKLRPVPRGRVSDAFCWRVTDLLEESGSVGLYIPAKTLTNEECKRFRAAFFTQNTVYRITNFANLVYILFAKRANHPAATIIFTKKREDDTPSDIVHYGPFVVHQKSDQSSGNLNDQVWAINIYENDIQLVDPEDAEAGDHIVWKLALWGYRQGAGKQTSPLDGAVLGGLWSLTPDAGSSKELANWLDQKDKSLFEAVVLKAVLNVALITAFNCADVLIGLFGLLTYSPLVRIALAVLNRAR